MLDCSWLGESGDVKLIGSWCKEQNYYKVWWNIKREKGVECVGFTVIFFGCKMPKNDTWNKTTFLDYLFSGGRAGAVEPGRMNLDNKELRVRAAWEWTRRRNLGPLDRPWKTSWHQQHWHSHGQILKRQTGCWVLRSRSGSEAEGALGLTQWLVSSKPRQRVWGKEQCHKLEYLSYEAASPSSVQARVLVVWVRGEQCTVGPEDKLFLDHLIRIV